MSSILNHPACFFQDADQRIYLTDPVYFCIFVTEQKHYNRIDKIPETTIETTSTAAMTPAITRLFFGLKKCNILSPHF